MKKYIYILAAAAALVGCAKEVTPAEETQNQKPETGVKTVTFTASIESPDTKGTIASGGAFTWSATDKVAVWTSGEGAQKRTATASNISGGSAEFTFTLGDNETIAEGAILVYPADRLTAATTVDFTPKVFNTADAPAAEPILAAKLGEDRTELKFKYVCGTVQIPFADIPCAANTIYIQQVSGSLGGNGVISFIDHDSNSATDEVPSYSGSFADNVSIDLTSWGHKTVILPVLNTGTRDLYVSLKEGNVELFYKTKSLTVQRNSYFKMASLTINPTVYFLSDILDWDVNTGSDNTISIGENYLCSYEANVIASGNKYFRYTVKYPTNNWIDYGFAATGTDGNAGGTFEIGKTNSPYFTADYDVYKFSFNYVTGEFTVTEGSDYLLYLVGANDSSWAFDSKTDHMTKLESSIFYWTGTPTQSTCKIYARGKTSWSDGIPSWDNGSGGDISLTTGSVNSIVVNVREGKTSVATAFNKESVTLKGSFDSWGSGKDFSKTDVKGLWKLSDFKVTETTYLKLVIDSSYTGGYTENDSISTYPDYGLCMVGTGNNLSIAAGTYNIYYNEANNRCYTVAQ